MASNTNEQMRSTHLHDQAVAYGCWVETHPETTAIFLRDVPGDLQGDRNFERFVEECRQHNVEATQSWKCRK